MPICMQLQTSMMSNKYDKRPNGQRTFINYQVQICPHCAAPQPRPCRLATAVERGPCPVGCPNVTGNSVAPGANHAPRHRCLGPWLGNWKCTSRPHEHLMST